MCLPALIPAEGGDKEEFHSWCIQHKRVYSSEAEEGKAFGAYLSNRALVQELNQAIRWVSGDVEEEGGGCAHRAAACFSQGPVQPAASSGGGAYSRADADTDRCSPLL